MTRKDTLLALAARCEAASGAEDAAWFDELARAIHDVDPKRPVNGSCRDYPRSLDAAMTLVDESFDSIRFIRDYGGTRWMAVLASDDTSISGDLCATKELGLAAACLRALAALEDA